MKPAPFDYAAPRTVEAALELLDDDAKVLAGGQSLVPVMNFRLARPGKLVDINRIAELGQLRKRDGALHIGALTRHATVERSAVVAAGWPLLCQAVRHVGHPQIRARGTLGGSCAHADPTAEMPVALTALDARFHVRSRTGARTVAAADFFVTQLTTVLGADELLVEVEVPPLPDGARTGFAEYAPTHGDWATAGAAVVLAPGHAAIALLGAGPTPVRATEAEAALAGGAAGRGGGAARRAAGRRPVARRAHGLARDPRARGGRRVRIAVDVNGQRHEADVEPRTLLSDFLRHDLGLTGTHVGCEHGVCGACTVQVDGEPVRACLMFAVQTGGPVGADRRGARGRGRRACIRSSRRSTRPTRCSAASAPRAC